MSVFTLRCAAKGQSQTGCLWALPRPPTALGQQGHCSHFSSADARPQGSECLAGMTVPGSGSRTCTLAEPHPNPLHTRGGGQVIHHAVALLLLCSNNTNIKSFFSAQKEKTYKWARNKLEMRENSGYFPKKIPTLQLKTEQDHTFENQTS